MTILRMCIACWIPKGTNTHSEYVIVIAFSTTTVVARTCLNVTLYVHCLSRLAYQQDTATVRTANDFQYLL